VDPNEKNYETQERKVHTHRTLYPFPPVPFYLFGGLMKLTTSSKHSLFHPSMINYVCTQSCAGFDNSSLFCPLPSDTKSTNTEYHCFHYLTGKDVRQTSFFSVSCTDTYETSPRLEFANVPSQYSTCCSIDKLGPATPSVCSIDKL
jgi:hypothetical protein